MSMLAGQPVNGDATALRMWPATQCRQGVVASQPPFKIETETLKASQPT